MTLADWVDELQKTGRYAFTRNDVRHALGQSTGTLDQSLQRLSAQGRILLLRRNFYVLVPLEYHSLGTVPTEWFIDDLMRFLGRPYYIGCLSAAGWHGAAHQRPQETQVVVPESIRDVQTRAVRIRFLRNAGMKNALTEARRTQTGNVLISTPEWTAIDLIRFHKHYGSMDAVATVLTELAEALSPDRLAAAAGHEPTNAYLQRLGWMLDFLRHEQTTGPLHTCVLRRRPSFTPLNASLKNRNGHRDSRWRVIVNEEPEADL